jgi:putative component of toxin-antitoxin plasmid stabilization module
VDVREYLTADGRNPHREWLDTLDVAPRARIQARVLRFSAGNLGDHKTVGRGVWEVRVMFGPEGIGSTSARTAPISCSCCSVATSPPRPQT